MLTVAAGKVLVVGENTETRHAEADALRKYRKSKFYDPGLKIDIYVFRVNFCGQLRESKPCHHCLNKIKKYKIVNVYYSTLTGDICLEKAKNMKSVFITGCDR